MKELSYSEIVSIENNLYRKIIKYINDYFMNLNIDTIDFHYPNFSEDKASKAFDFWLIMDYITDENKTFITHILEDNSSNFSFIEKSILKEIKDVYLSLYEVIRVKNNSIEVFDLLNNEKHKLYYDESINLLKTGDILLGRTGKLMDYKVFLGSFSYLPSTSKNQFINIFFKEYNKSIKSEFIDIKTYLKLYSINLYKIYTELMYELIELDEDSSASLYDEIDLFRDYIKNFLSSYEVDEYVDNLMNFFELYLMEKDLDLYDIAKIDFEALAKKSMEENYINNKEDFLSYLKTFKIYFRFLKNRDKFFEKTYNKILELSKNRFIYLELINKIDTPFKINKKFSRGLNKRFNEKAFSILMDFDNFLIHLLESPICLDKNNQLSMDDYLEINDIMENQTEIINNKDKNQFNILNLFINFSLNLGIINIQNGFLVVTNKSDQFLRLSDQDKYTLIFDYVWNDNFLKNIKNKNIFNDNDRIILINLLNNLDENKYNKLDNILENLKFSSDNLNHNYGILELLGIINYNDDKLKLTNFGKLLLKLNINSSSINSQGKIININEIKKIK